MGWTRVRFLAPVKAGAGARVRLHVTLMELEQEGGVVTGSDNPPLIADVSSRPAREPEKSGCGRSRTTAAAWLGVATSSRRRLERSRTDESVVQGCSRSPQRRDAHQVHFTRRRAWQRSRSSI